MGRARHCRAKRGSETENRRDRFSGLPDHILVSILSLLPLKSAIATDVLSKRWQGLWSHHSVIDFCINKRHDKFFNSIDKLLPKLTSPIIDRFSLVIDTPIRHTKTLSNEKRRNYSHIPSWFDWAFRHGAKQVHEFRFAISDELDHLRDLYPDTPLCVFQMSSLVILELRPWLFVHSDYDDDNSSFNLPNLKKLFVELHSFNIRVLEKLVSNSPCLEDLSFKLRLVYKKYLSLNLASTSIKRLDMDLICPIEIVMNTPSLEYLGIDMNSRDESHYFLNAPTALLGVLWHKYEYRISFLNSPTALLGCSIHADTHDHFGLIQPSAFCSAISNVVSLTVIGEQSIPQLAATTFIRLAHLTLKVYFSEKAVFQILGLSHQCPVLEVLTFDMTQFSRLKRWSSLPDSAPHCLVTCFQRIEIQIQVPSSGHLAAEYLLHLLNYLLGSATTLKLLKIDLIPPRLERRGKIVCNYDEPQLIKEVLRVPRSSPQCRIEFNGLHYKGLGGGGTKSNLVLACWTKK